MSDTEFVDGMRVYAPNEGAPDYIIANVVVNAGGTLEQWLHDHPGEQRIVIKRSKGGKLYAARDTWKPNAERSPSKPVKDCPQPDQRNAGGGFTDDDIPFAPLGKHSHWIA